MGSVKEKQAHASLTYLHWNCQNSYFKSASVCCAAGLQSAGCGRRGGSRSGGCTPSVLAWATASSCCHSVPSLGSCGSHWRRPALPFLALSVARATRIPSQPRWRGPVINVNGKGDSMTGPMPDRSQSGSSLQPTSTPPSYNFCSFHL